MASPSHESVTLGTANIATGITAGTGMISYLNENAWAISVIIALASLFIALVFYVLNYRLKVRATELYRDEILGDIINQMKHQAAEEGVDTTCLVDVASKVKERRGTPRFK